jgi:hypothetical protein
MPVMEADVNELIDQVEQLERDATPAEKDVLITVRRRLESLV